FQAGFKPVFVDVKRETLNIDVDKIEAAITRRTRAIMPVHLMGKPADMDRIMAIAEKHKLFVVEDAAEAHGAEYKGRLIGTIGHMAAFSLYAAHIVTSIEGGMVITDDEQMAEAVRSLRNHGIVNKFEFRRIGFSAKMNEIEAAVGIGNIRIFKDILGTRRRNLLYLIEHFRKFDEYFISVKEDEGEKIGPHAFSVILKEGLNFSKEEIVADLDRQGIDSRNLFYSMPTQCPSYAFLGHTLGDFPEAEYCADHGFHIGIHQDIGLAQLDYVVEGVAAFLKSKGLSI
ncbi:MAG: DegT/DnrJ/EryC1/StrS family aminotransferase, partial [Candidatus Omnitrophota bacterium]